MEKKEFILIIEDRCHKATIKYHPKVGFVYQIRFLTEVSELREKTIELPEEDFDKILSMFNPIELKVQAADTVPHRNIVFPKFTVRAGSNVVTDNHIYKLSDDEEVYKEACAIENMILEKDPELKAHFEASKRVIDLRDEEERKRREKERQEEEEKERARITTLNDIRAKYPALFKGRELSLEGARLLAILLGEKQEQETQEPGVGHGK